MSNTVFFLEIPLAARSEEWVCGFESRWKHGYLFFVCVVCCQFACWDCGFESRWKHGCMSLENVVLCQVEVSELGLIICPSELISKPQQRGGLNPLWLPRHGKKVFFLYVRNNETDLLNLLFHLNSLSIKFNFLIFFIKKY